MKGNSLVMHPFRSRLNEFDSGSLILPALSTKVKISWSQSYFYKQIVILFQGTTKGVLRRPSQDHILFAQYRGTQDNPLVIIGIKCIKNASIHANIHLKTELKNIWREEWNQILKSNFLIQKIPEKWFKIDELEQKPIPKAKKEMFDMVLDEDQNLNSSSNQVNRKNFTKDIDSYYQLSIKEKLDKLKYTDEHHKFQKNTSQNKSKKIKKMMKRQNKQEESEEVKAFKRFQIMKQKVIKAPFQDFDEGAIYFSALKSKIKISWTNLYYDQTQVKEVKVDINNKAILIKPVSGYIMYIVFFGSSEQPMGIIGFKSKTNHLMYHNVITQISSRWSKEFTNLIRSNIQQEDIPQDWVKLNNL